MGLDGVRWDPLDLLTHQSIRLVNGAPNWPLGGRETGASVRRAFGV